MSASKDKINRKQQVKTGTDRRTLAKQQEEREQRRATIRYSVIAVVIVLILAFVFIYNSVLPSRLLTAVEINGEKYTVAQLNYYYSVSYNNLYNYYYYYFMLGYGPFSTDEKLDQQQYTEDMTWHDYFLESAVESIKQIQMLCEEAEAAGHTMTEAEQAEYEEACLSIENDWVDYGYENLKQFLSLTYGKGVTLKLVEQEMYRAYLASSYSQYLYDGYEYETDELDAYYTEHEEEYDKLTYAYYLLSASNYTSDDVTEEQATELLADYAAEIVAAVDGADEASLNDYLADNFDDAAATSATTAGSSLSELYASWLLDTGRKAGDTASFESDGSQYVVMFLERDKNDYYTAGFRHILVKAVDEDEDGAYSDEEFQLAHDTAEEYYAEWLSGAADEESFATMANLNSEDTGSNENGGLYEDVYKGQMVTPINDWLFAADRKAGDTAVIDYNEGGSYTGTHVVYFTGYSDMTYARYQADSALRSEALNDWIDERLENYTAATSNLKLCGQNH